MELFIVTKKSEKAVISSCLTKAGAKEIRDSLNAEAKWSKNDPKDPDNCNSMPYVIRKGKDHWKA